MNDSLSIGELADAVGVSRRAVRFYVQRGLLPPPAARGRGAHYEAAHVERLREILRLQAAGHSLTAIGALLAGGSAAPRPAMAGLGEAAPAAAAAPVGPGLEARLRPELLIRLRLADGVELQLDASLYNPDAAVLLALREAVLRTLLPGPPEPP